MFTLLLTNTCVFLMWELFLSVSFSLPHSPLTLLLSHPLFVSPFLSPSKPQGPSVPSLTVDITHS